MNSATEDHRYHAQPGADITGFQSRIRPLALVFYPDPILRTVCEPVSWIISTAC